MKWETPKLISLTDPQAQGLCNLGSGDSACNVGNLAGAVCVGGVGGKHPHLHCDLGFFATVSCDVGANG